MTPDEVNRTRSASAASIGRRAGAIRARRPRVSRRDLIAELARAQWQTEVAQNAYLRLVDDTEQHRNRSRAAEQALETLRSLSRHPAVVDGPGMPVDVVRHMLDQYDAEVEALTVYADAMNPAAAECQATPAAG